MTNYDDFATMNPQKFELAVKEYSSQKSGKILQTLSQNNNSDILMVQKKVEYLQNLVIELKSDTSNADVLKVLEGLGSDIKVLRDKITALADSLVSVEESEEIVTARFCNNLKLAIQTCCEIVKLLVKIKDDEKTSGENKLFITEIISSVVDINNKLVSLFGECRYRYFKS